MQTKFKMVEVIVDEVSFNKMSHIDSSVWETFTFNWLESVHQT